MPKLVDKLVGSLLFRSLYQTKCQTLDFKGKHFWIDLRGMEGLGNFLLFFPVIENISRLQEVKITLWISNGKHLQLSQFLRENVRSVRVPLRHLVSFKEAFRLGRVDYAITTGSSRLFILICLIKRIPVRVGFDGQFAFRYVPNWYQNFFTHKVQVPRRDHEINVNLGIIKVLGIPTICSVPIIIPGKDALENAKTFYIRHGVSKKATIVGLQPGSSPDQVWKRWPMEYYQELIRWCQSQGFTVLIFGSDKERKICESLRGPKGTVLAVGEHIQLVAALLKQCAVLVSHDSFLIHLACALGVPNLGLYGPTDVIWSESWGEKSFQIHIRRECRYCYSQDPENPATCDVNCMSEISPEEVIRKIKDGILVSH